MGILVGIGAVFASTATPTPDPFNPDVSMFPPAPGWLFPTVMILFGIGLAVVLVLLIMWSMARRKAAELSAPRNTNWINLNEVNDDARRNGHRGKPSRDDDAGAAGGSATKE